LTAAVRETNARVRIQFALSLGELRDPRAFVALTRFAHEDVRWMDAAVLSSLGGREGDLLAELLRKPSPSESFVTKLAQAIGARRDETELARVLKLLGYAPADVQAAALDGLGKGRKNAPRKPLTDKMARTALTNFIASASGNVSKAARGLAQTFVATEVDEAGGSSTGSTIEQISEEAFGKFIAALKGRRDLKRGHEVFVQACATCHRMGTEGFEVGPDLIGQLGIAEEALLKDILLPSERIRPGYETTEVKLRDGSIVTGLLKDDGATTLILAQAGGLEQSLLRKDVADVRRTGSSLMPPFGEGLTPSDVANLLAWLRSNLAR
jgi:putative heme-binding domain-containing protein